MQSIDPSCVLLIVNSSIQQSLLDAQDYITRRGLNSNHILSFNFGQYYSSQLIASNLYTNTTISCQTSGVYSGMCFMDAICQYRKNNPIDAIILSTYTPVVMYNDTEANSNYRWIVPLAVYAGSSFGGIGVNFAGINSGSGDYPSNATDNHGTPEKIIEKVIENWKPTIGKLDTTIHSATYVSTETLDPNNPDSTTLVLNFGGAQPGLTKIISGTGIVPRAVSAVLGTTGNYHRVRITPALTTTASGTYTFIFSSWGENYNMQIPHGRLGCPDGIGSDRYNLGNPPGYKYDYGALPANTPIAEAPVRPTVVAPTWDTKKGLSVSVDDVICVDNGHKGTFYYYKVTTAGTLHATVWPTHSTGTQSNGTAQLEFQYIESVYRSAVTNGLIAESQNQLNSAHVFSQTHEYVHGTYPNNVTFNWSKQMGMPNVYRVGLAGSTIISPPFPYNGAPASATLDILGTAQSGIPGPYNQLGAGISSTQTTIQVADVSNMASSGVVEIRGYPVAKLTAPLNVGDTTMQVDNIEGFTDPNAATRTGVGKYWIRTLPNYTQQIFTFYFTNVTGSSSPYTLHLNQAVTQAMPTGACVFGTSYECREHISYTSIDTSVTPPKLLGCTRAKDDASLRDFKYYQLYGPTQIGSTSGWTAPWSYQFESGSTVIPISPYMKKRPNDKYYFYPGGMSCYDPDLPPFFGLCIDTGFNIAPTIYDDLNGKVAVGGWGFTWTSYAGIFAEGMLRNGGSAAVATHTEPYASNLTPTCDLFVLTSHYQMPLMLGLFHSSGGHGALTVYGDPLYAPYKSTPTSPPTVTMNLYGF